MASEGRWASRLAHLSHDELVAVAAKGCAANRATARAADERLSVSCPLPEWAIRDVLLLPDLVVNILSYVDPFNAAVPLTCSSWRDGWKQMLCQTRVLHPMPCSHADIGFENVFSMGVAGEELLVETHCGSAGRDNVIRFLDRDMKCTRSPSLRRPRVVYVNNEAGIVYLREELASGNASNDVVRARRLPGLQLLAESPERRVIDCGAGSKKWIVGIVEEETDSEYEDETYSETLLVLYEPDTLLERGTAPLSHTLGSNSATLAMHNDEVFVGHYDGKISVHSIVNGSGFEFLRTINVRRCTPVDGILSHDDRLYVTCQSDNRISVFSLAELHDDDYDDDDQNVLQTYHHPVRHARLSAMAVFNDRLLVADSSITDFQQLGHGKLLAFAGY